MASFSTILVANRGEIACRILRTARAKGYRTVAVFSDADESALHVAMADVAVHIGPPAVSDSYLSIEKIIEAARRSGADAVHPGYGFLSENAEFAAACAEAGITFIGPSAEAIALMGNKAAAKRRMIEAGVPCVPGYEGEAQDDSTLIAEAKRIGFPVMIKAAAGGGGRGMRVVESEEGMAEGLRSARSEAGNAFGSEELILEKALKHARHVEVQIVGDTHGNVLHFGERDCSVQRRHQKVIEETPCPAISDETRTAMTGAAVTAARSIGYTGAGTIEFLLDESGAFYFLEMNTRLQVEHPVTEYVTGIDLVALQLDVAAGAPLPMRQDEIRFDGHAIEVRVYAEDADQDFLPQSGVIAKVSLPEGPGLRIDHGLYDGAPVSSFYDPLLAKVIAHGPTREEARTKLVGALHDMAVLGLTTNKAFLIRMLEHETFVAGEATTGLIEETWQTGDVEKAPSIEHLALAAVVLIEEASKNVSPLLKGWHSTGESRVPILFEFAGTRYTINISMNGNIYSAVEGERNTSLQILECAGNRVVYECEGVRSSARFSILGNEVHIDTGAEATLMTDATYAPAEAHSGPQDGVLRAPMNGQAVRVAVKEGDSVSKGQILVVIEAMKMENQIVATTDGVVETVSVREGEQVALGKVLLSVVPAEK